MELTTLHAAVTNVCMDDFPSGNPKKHKKAAGALNIGSALDKAGATLDNIGAALPIP